MSDNVLRFAVVALVSFVSFASSSGQEHLGVVVDSAAYLAARDNPNGLYFHIVWEPASSGPNTSSVYSTMEYTSSRPSSFNTVSRFGFQSASGNTTERYILARGDNLLIAQNEVGSSAVASINQNLSRFGLGTSEERAAVVSRIEDLLNGISIELPTLVNSSSVMSILTIIGRFLLLSLELAVASFLLFQGFKYLKRLVKGLA